MADAAESRTTDPIAHAIGVRVEQERDRLGITKEELGARSGLASRYIWRVEAGRLNVQLRNLAKIAEGLGVTVSELTAGLEGLVADPPERERKPRRGPLPKTAHKGP